MNHFHLIEGRVEISHASFCFVLHGACSDLQDTMWVCGWGWGVHVCVGEGVVCVGIRAWCAWVCKTKTHVLS